MGPWATMAPLLMMTTPPHTMDTSGRMCVERMTVWLPASDLMRAADLGDLPGVEPDGRLVEDQDLGVVHDGLGQAHPLAVALGEGADEPILHVGDEAALHHLGHPGPALGPGPRPLTSATKSR